MEGEGKILVQGFWGGGKILVQRDFKALLKHLVIPLKIFTAARAAGHYQYNTTTFANIPIVIGHFVMMCNTDNTKMASSKFTCKCIDTDAVTKI